MLIFGLVISVFVLERLSDGDIRDIVTGAVQRVSDQSIPNTETSDNSHPPSSQPTLVEQQSSQSLSEPVPSSTQSLFPAYPQITHKVLDSIVSLSTGDARTALSLTELAISSAQSVPPHVLIDSLRRSVSTSYDRTGDSHYDLISALHKSVRGSDGTAALYWLARMLEAGEDPVFIARRMVVCSSEDVGLADNHALPLVRCDMSTLDYLLRNITGSRNNASVSAGWHARVPYQSRTLGFISLGSAQVNTFV